MRHAQQLGISRATRKQVGLGEKLPLGTRKTKSKLRRQCRGVSGRKRLPDRCRLVQGGHCFHDGPAFHQCEAVQPDTTRNQFGQQGMRSKPGIEDILAGLDPARLTTQSTVQGEYAGYGNDAIGSQLLRDAGVALPTTRSIAGPSYVPAPSAATPMRPASPANRLRYGLVAGVVVAAVIYALRASGIF